MTDKGAGSMKQDLAHRFEGNLTSKFDLLHAQQDRDDDDEFNAGLLIYLLILLGIEAVMVFGMHGHVVPWLKLAGVAVASLFLSGLFFIVAIPTGIVDDLAGALIRLQRWWSPVAPAPSLTEQELREWVAGLPAVTPQGKEQLAKILESDRVALSDLDRWIDREAHRQTQAEVGMSTERRVTERLQGLRTLSGGETPRAQVNGGRA